MTKKRVRILLISLSTLLICLALIVAGTYALFSDYAKIGNHLQAGTLDITLTREKLTSYYLTAEGTMATATVDEDADFSAPTSENLFGVSAGTKIVPTSKYTADMVLKNGGNVAFNYWIEIVLDTGKTNSENFAKQLQVTVKVGETEVTQTLYDGLFLGTEAAPNGLVAVGGSVNFSVSVEYLSLAANNDADAQEVWFDMIVHAVQATA